jgi:HD-GYP domain-containing protein (c-di-GMP phosphodiesterase class II)
LSEEAVLRVRLAGWLRNVGKVAIPESVLRKSGPLNDEEWEVVRTHPVVGEELLRHLPELSRAGPAVRSRHERYDGMGYPDRLAGEDIPLEARIVAATDAFVAMTTERSHSGRRTTAEAIAELRHGSGTQFDPRIVDLLVQSVLVPAIAENPTS